MKIIKIDKDVPIPPDNKNKRFPFDKMEVGDSFLYSESNNESAVRNACMLWKGYVKRAGLDWKFTVRKMDEGVRIWRVE